MGDVGRADELRKLADLHAAGVLDDAEFARLKQETVDGDRPRPGRSRVRARWVAVAVGLLVAVVIGAVLVLPSSNDDAERFELFVNDGTAMVPFLTDGQAFHVDPSDVEPERGDVIVLEQVEGVEARRLVKRVIALPGETVEMRDCVVLVDAVALEERYLDAQVVGPDNCGTNFSPVTIPDDYVWVMGDNRGGSQDSRDIGPIDLDDIVGVVVERQVDGGEWEEVS